VLAAVEAAELQAGLRVVRVLHVLLGFLVTFPRLAEAQNRKGDSEGGSNVALKMTNRQVDDIAVLQMEGRIVLGEESNALREQVKNLLGGNMRKIVLNMGNVTYIDSAGLGTLVAAFHSARGQGATLKLCNLGQKFQEVLQVTKLMTVFEVFDSEASAIQSFGK
jgi:anti-sigma B factor antagonist